VIEQVLLDKGPLVAMLSSRDPYHEACLQVSKQLRGTLVTCWPVLTEAAWLLRTHSDGIQRLLAGVSTRLFRIAELPNDSAAWIATFLERYATAEVQLADAALVYLATHEKIETIFTTDRRHFSTFRLPNNRAFRILPEA